jgi:hypothetical protein
MNLHHPIGRPLRGAVLRRGLRAALVALGLGVAGMWPSVARGQEIARELGSVLTPMPRPLIDKAKRLLNLDDDQFEIVKDLYQGYRAAYRSVVEESDARRHQMYEKARDGDGDAAEAKSREMMKKTIADLDRLDETFMSDLRAILSGGQAATIDEFERAKRRESTRHSSMLSGEGADPIDILQHLTIDPSSLADFPTAAADYAESLDRQIVARSRIWRAGYDSYLSTGDWQVLRDAYPKLYVVSKQIRDLNRRFSRQIAEMLSDADRARFEEEFRRRSYPQVYQESVIAKRLKAARNADALTDSQKDQLTSVEHSYDRDAEAINVRWRSSLDRVQELIVSSGSRSWDSSEAQTLREVVEERVRLDKSFLDRIDAVLSEEQAGRLPATSREMPRLRGDALPDWDRESVRKWLKDKD